MAQTNYEFPVKDVRGAIAARGVVSRKKNFRTPDGISAGEGPCEIYQVKNPRNYKKNPPIGRERDNLLINQQAWKQAAFELKDKTSETYQAWLKRYEAQLTHGEPDAPIDPATLKPKVYKCFRAFVRTAIRRQILADRASGISK